MTNHRSRVIGVVTSFNPSDNLITHCAEIQRQVSNVVVVDDGSSEQSNETLAKLESSGVHVIYLEENLGIGRAINVGLEVAKAFSPDFVVTFDQDSSIRPGFIDALVDEYDRLEKRGIRVGMVAPNYYSKTSQGIVSADREYVEAEAPIQSGLLMSLVAIEKLGEQREDFFIDLIDTEYALRARREGYVIACAPGLVLPHGFGNQLYVHAFGRRLHKADGRPRLVAVSSPFRYYYRARNRILLNREFKGLAEFRRELWRQTMNDLVLDFGVALWSARGKWALVRVIFAGWRDGLRGRVGKIPMKIFSIAENVSWRHPVNDELDE